MPQKRLTLASTARLAGPSAPKQHAVQPEPEIIYLDTTNQPTTTVIVTDYRGEVAFTLTAPRLFFTPERQAWLREAIDHDFHTWSRKAAAPELRAVRGSR